LNYMKIGTILCAFLVLPLLIQACGGVESGSDAIVREEGFETIDNARLLWKEAQALELESEFGKALDRYEDLVDDYPESELSSSAQFRIGVCLEKEDELYDAFEAYQTLLDDYPGKGNLGEILKRQFDIGKAFLDGRKRYFLFFRIRSGLGTAEKIFRTVVNNATFSRVSPQAQYSLGEALRMQGNYEDAVTEYEVVLNNYPGTDVIPLALFNLGVCYYEEALRSDYDPKEVDKAVRYFKRFVKRYPNNPIRAEADEKISELIDLKAEKAYDIAAFYESAGSPEGARLYYRKIIDKYPDSRYARLAREKLPVQ
ncbi:MAG: outer membrane protein assembly factor BamD, partial [Candidatus Euphemobacter frigidus]|nr:outer membrane protein assembly factor BamD [Candidatus Euphemobacter frigidus]